MPHRKNRPNERIAPMKELPQNQYRPNNSNRNLHRLHGSLIRTPRLRLGIAYGIAEVIAFREFPLCHRRTLSIGTRISSRVELPSASRSCIANRSCISNRSCNSITTTVSEVSRNSAGIGEVRLDGRPVEFANQHRAVIFVLIAFPHTAAKKINEKETR